MAGAILTQIGNLIIASRRASVDERKADIDAERVLNEFVNARIAIAIAHDSEELQNLRIHHTMLWRYVEQLRTCLMDANIKVPPAPDFDMFYKKA